MPDGYHYGHPLTIQQLQSNIQIQRYHTKKTPGRMRMNPSRVLTSCQSIIQCRFFSTHCPSIKNKYKPHLRQRREKPGLGDLVNGQKRHGRNEGRVLEQAGSGLGVCVAYTKEILATSWLFDERENEHTEVDYQRQISTKKKIHQHCLSTKKN
jgi:hypothetical protein